MVRLELSGADSGGLVRDVLRPAARHGLGQPHWGRGGGDLGESLPD